MLYSFGDYTLDAEHYELRQAMRLVPVEPRVLDLLTYLVQHPGRTVTTEELKAQLYPQQFAPDDRLTNAVAQARKALGDTGQTQRYIQTVRRRGYRFVAPVTARPPGAEDLRAASTPDMAPSAATPAIDQTNTVAPLAPRPAASSSARPQTPLTDTPAHLAEKSPTSKGALEGERKQVTVFYANLQGAAELLADRDPEEAQRLLDPFLTGMMEVIHRYEGTVNHIVDDGMMALFGVPLAHEDHTARACYAALAMQKAVRQCAEELRRAHGIEIQSRVALNSGEVVMRAIGNDLHMEYLAVGQTAYLAAQLERFVVPGAIWLTGETLRSVEGLVQVKPLDPVRIAGLRDDVEVYELINAEPTRTRLHAAARVLTPFVGRQHEIETLRQALERAGTGHGQVVAVIGEPGVGKSRLFYEFAQASHTHGWAILEAGAMSSYGKATPYLPIIDLLKTYFQLEGADDGRELPEKVADTLLALDAALRPTLPAFLTLLDLPVEDPQWQDLDPRQRRQRMLDAVKRVLLRESQVQPLLVIVENLHWIDTETQAVLDSMVESLPTARLLLLVNYRPEYQHCWGNKTYYTQIQLDPLPWARAEELLHALLGRDASLQPVMQRLIERTDGNPLFLEESVWTLSETKALVGERGAYRLAQALPSIQVPATVQAVLADRIDRLPAEEKRLLQVAAIIGKEVPFTLLQAMADGPEEAMRQSLAHLQNAEFLYELQLFPEQVYTFKHALTQEVAYQSLLQRTRQQYHQQIAHVLAERFPETVTTHPELLAYHYTEAGLSAQAVPYWQQAGQRAIGRSANHEAISHLTKGLAVLRTLPDTPARVQHELPLQLALGATLSMLKGYTAADTEQAYRRARQLCQLEEDGPARFAALAEVQRFYRSRSALTTAQALGAELLSLAKRLGDATCLLKAHCALGLSLWYRGAFAAALTHLEQGLAHFDPHQSPAQSVVYWHPAVACAAFAARAAWFLGYPDQALWRNQELLTVARQLAQPYHLASALHFSAALHIWRREPHIVLEQADAALGLSREHGFLLWVGGGLIRKGWALAALGSVEAGIEHLRQGIALSREMGMRQAELHHLGMLAEAYQHGGQPEAAWRVLAEAVAILDSSEERYYQSEAYRLRGELLLADGSRLEAAEASFRQARTVARQQGAKSLELRATMGLCRLWQQQGRRTKARHTLAAIYDGFTEGFGTADLQEAKALLNALE